MENPEKTELVCLIVQNNSDLTLVSLDLFIEYHDADQSETDIANGQYVQSETNIATDKLVAGQTLTIWTKEMSFIDYAAMGMEDLVAWMKQTAESNTWDENDWVMQFQAQRR